MRQYRLTFEFRDTIEQAQALCDLINKNYTYYMRKHNPAHFTTWSSQDGKENKFVCWYKA